MNDSAYQAVLDFLYQQLPMFQRQGASAFKKDLTNITALCKSLHNPQDKITCIHIAGTNGKGTTTHILSSIYQSAGFKVGVYTSPHYLDLRERIKIGNQLISKQALIAFIKKVKPLLHEIKPSFFELMVAMAFDYFANEKVDIAIIETGLGGRLDSTNVITPALSVITNISYDHQDMLGETLQEIATEKAGIIKPKVPVIIGQTQEEVSSIFLEKAKENKAAISFADQDWSVDIIEDKHDRYIVNIKKDGDLKFEQIVLDLKGEVMLKNLVTALGCIEQWDSDYLPISKSQIIHGLANIKQQSYFLGRMQVLGREPIMIADSAHNADGLLALFNELDKLDFDSLYIVFGMVSDKPLSKILEYLPTNAKYYAVQANIPRAKTSIKLHAELSLANLDVIDAGSVENGKNLALEGAKSNDLVLICGSIFVVAEIEEIALSL